MYKALVLQVAGNIGVVTEGTTLLIITQISSDKILHMLRSCRYKYLHVKIASLAIMKSCVAVGGKYFASRSCHGLVLSLTSWTVDTSITTSSCLVKGKESLLASKRKAKVVWLF